MREAGMESRLIAGSDDATMDFDGCFDYDPAQDPDNTMNPTVPSGKICRFRCNENGGVRAKMMNESA